MTRYLTLAGFLVFTLGGGLLIGLYNMPGQWYESLNKPPFNPPDWVFGPVWTVLYILVAIAGWRSWERRADGPAMQLWFGQMALNFLWTPVFFSMHRIGLAAAVITALFLLIVGFMTLSWNRDRLAAFLFLPYALWVGFATLLNVAIFLLN